ncbi:double-stranded RNA-specific editase B2 isoform X4 [Camelus dromedarius]|uniref:double-stranded RNA-specific editase B2 isoform X4 n=1 Tax=Camelus dromedarius TaxID=9838 RepID=UPI003119F57D
MASVLGTSRASGGLSGQLKCKSKRRRRRRSKRKDKVSTLSAFVAPFKHVSPGATSTEDEDNLSTSSADVKENRNVSNLEARPLPVGDRTRGGPPGLKRKRPLEEGGGGPLRQLHLLWRGLSWSVAPKNALVQLHELRPGLQYRTVSQTGPVHAPVFAVAVEVNGLTFEGTGPTKKKAKMRAAELALRSFVQFPNACQAHLALGSGASPSPDFTSDQADFPDTLFKQFEPAAPSEAFPGRRPAAPERLSAACRRGRLLCRPLDLVGTAAPGERNPVVLLNELRSGLRYVCLSEPEKQRAQSFVMAVNVDGRTFEGSGRSKKLAKGQAAQAALQALFDIRLPGHIPSRNKGHLLPQEFADSVSQLVTQKFHELSGGLAAAHARHKALAGIVMTQGLDVRQAQVVVLSSGTKCISGDHINDQGLVVNDCHAEIVARRALVHFLYAQLELHLSEQRQAPGQEVPGAPAHEDRVRGGDGAGAWPGRGADVGRRPAGRAAGHHVLYGQDRQVERAGCAGRAALPLHRACVPAQHRGGEPAPHRPPRPGDGPPARGRRPAAHLVPAQPAPAQWSESGRGPAAREVAALQRELGGGRCGRGGGGRHHREEELRPLVPALQAQAVRPVGAAPREAEHTDPKPRGHAVHVL